MSEIADASGHRSTSLEIRLLGAYQDGHIEIVYPRVFNLNLKGSCEWSWSDWLYDEFRLLPNGNVIHEIEWAAQPSRDGARWLIEASDVEYRWNPVLLKN